MDETSPIAIPVKATLPACQTTSLKMFGDLPEETGSNS